MDIYQFFVLFTIAFVFVVTPGPGTLAVFAKSMAQGFFPALYLSIGMVLGDLVYLTAVIFSLDLFAQAITPLMGYIKILGALYLIYLGYNTWTAHKVKLNTSASHKSTIKELSTGLLISLTNPKVMVFYIAILPTFIDLSSINLTHAVKILATFGIGLLTGVTLVNLMVIRIKTLFAKPDMHQRINKISGGVMVLAGLFLGLS